MKHLRYHGNGVASTVTACGLKVARLPDEHRAVAASLIEVECIACLRRHIWSQDVLISEMRKQEKQEA